jgi:WD40 repeat protein
MSRRAVWLDTDAESEAVSLVRTSSGRDESGRHRSTYRLAVADRGRHDIELWSLRHHGGTLRAEHERSLVGHEERIVALRFTSGGDTLVSVTRGGTVYRWDVTAGAVLRKVEPPSEGAFESSQFATDAEGALVALMLDRHRIQIFDMEDGALHADLRLEDSELSAIHLTEEHLFVSVEAPARYIEMWSLR